MSFSAPKQNIPPAPPPTAPDPIPQISTDGVTGTQLDALGNVNKTKKKGVNGLVIPLDNTASGTGIQIGR